MSHHDLIVDNRPILVSQQEIDKRRYANEITMGSFAVDNIPMNPDTQHFFRDYVEGRIATNEDLVNLLHEYYSEIVKLTKP